MLHQDQFRELARSRKRAIAAVSLAHWRSALAAHEERVSLRVEKLQCIIRKRAALHMFRFNIVQNAAEKRRDRRVADKIEEFT